MWFISLVPVILSGIFVLIIIYLVVKIFIDEADCTK